MGSQIGPGTNAVLTIAAVFIFPTGADNNKGPKAGAAENEAQIIPRPELLLGKKQSSRRDERRRATHNEVERRRRDKINNWIIKLGSIIPDTCETPNSRSAGSGEGLSKGGILAAACEYITELKETNENLNRHKLEVAALCETSQFLVDENARLQSENQQLREILLRHGIQFEPEPVLVMQLAKDEEEESLTANTLSS